jgi:hypothetical protein
MALFGAIVAVGLGPALWLGAQFGQAAPPQRRPPAVISNPAADVQAPRGGSGAGDAPTGTEQTRTEPKANTLPLTRTKAPRPSASSTPPASASPKPSVSPTESTPPSDPDPTNDPTESTTRPSDPPVTDDPGDPPPAPPVNPRTEAVAGSDAAA